MKINDEILEQKALDWLCVRLRTNAVIDVDVLIWSTHHGTTIEFYDADETLPYFMTVSMVKELENGKSLAKIKQSYYKT